MEKRQLEQELKELQNKLSSLKTQVKEEEKETLYPLIKHLEESALTLKTELYRKITPIERVQLARHSGRPTTLDYIKYLIKDFIQLHGDRRYMDDLAIVAGVGFFENIPVTVIGHQKGRDTKDNIKRHFGMPHPEGYRKALRLMKQAEKFGRPIICFIDTPGAYPGIGAEERGQGEAIALNLYEMSNLKTQIISIVTGEGGSGGALALGVADKVFMLANTIYSVISPEGCASILWKDSGRAAEAADALKIDASSLLRMGIIDDIIEEPQGGAHEDHEGTVNSIKEKLLTTLEELAQYSIEDLIEQRYSKIRKMGQFKEVDA
ncbi:MAG: acetyl-CoA carboxylase carboxyltransferase subunit alpha [Spirochaetes bacterium GWD1_27_9]|nr:MAG: acetyl-CoA carboxylase carboxyltransferase subunit alpha [Spirochaetes bacterium GWB1_27_13]OHD25660.1 MAG: acetyl-CoA carboxylase carboxyltransferase subunit alpha [Spirochaetes bacterium GWC1_27_15]OHD41605.1 MAG: acetyl-CoA carboxylase carboxyltransferase subunit alpha [Spirochaetes bacterium GWD1_27_9]